MKYEVTIEARITKTYTVEADNQDAAYELAHESFSVLPDEAQEHCYEQETINIKKVNT
jgi:hypothetical protein